MAELIFASAQVRARAQEIDDLNAQFRVQVNSLADKEAALKSMYEGDAATTFHNAFQSDKTQMDNFYACIARYAAVLRDIAAKLEQTERENQQIAASRTY